MTYVKTFIDVPIPSVAAAPSKPLEATVFVAASDARSEVKSLADFVCTGSNDDVTIEQAINSLPAAGGRVVLSEGNFILGSSIDILKNNVTLEGQGAGTVIKGAIGTSYIIVGNGSTALSNIKIANLAIDGTGQTSGNGIYFYGGSGYLITNSIIKNCWIKKCYNYGIYLYYSNNNTVTGNNVQSNYYGIYIVSSSSNTVTGNNVQSNTYYGIYLDHSNNNTVTGNNVQSNGIGILVFYSNNNTVTGNNVQLNNFDGIPISYSNNNIVTGNILKDNGQQTHNNFEDIPIVDSNYNIISSNIIIATATKRTKWGIDEVDSNYNLIIGNYVSGQATGKIKLVGLNSIAYGNIEV